jgi:hypothetical protein
MNHSVDALRRAILVCGVALVAAACNSSTTTPTPTRPPAASVAPSQAATASPLTGGSECAPTDLALIGGGWSAAAGSRGADVSVENRGAAACTLPAGPAVAILDAAGTQLLESTPTTDEAGPSLEPGAVATFTVLFSNWCEDTVSLPLQVALRAGDAAIPVPGLDLTEDLPPCNGPGQPPVVSANPWEAVSG